MFGSFTKLLQDVADIALAPVVIAADITSAIVEPIADGARAVVQEVKDLTNND